MLNPLKPISAQAKYGLGAAALILTLGVWSLLTGLDVVSPAKLPAPWDVGSALLRLTWHSGESQLGPAIWASMSRIGIAAVLLIAVGVPTGVLMGASKAVNAFLSPLLDPFRSAPIVAILPILIMWFGIDETMKIVFLWLGAVVYLIPMTRDAVVAVEDRWFIMAKDRGASDLEAIWTTVIPMASPRIADGVITSISVMWTYITVAEYVNADTGLGKLAQQYRKVSQMDSVFAVILVILLLSLITYNVMVAWKNWKYDWSEA